MSNEAEPAQSVDLSLEKLRGSLGRIGSRSLSSYQYLLDLGSILMSGSAKTSETDFEDFRSSTRFMPSSRTALSFERAKFETNRWVAKHLFEDGMRIVEALLEDLRTLAALATLPKEGDTTAGVGQITGEDRGEFIRLPLAERLKKLDELYGIQTQFGPGMISVAAATRCLRVRGGIVGKGDSPDGNGLLINWVTPGTGRPEAEKSDEAAAKRRINLNRVQKTFAVGQPIELSKQEIVAGLFTLLMFVTTLLQSADAYFKSLPSDDQAVESPS